VTIPATSMMERLVADMQRRFDEENEASIARLIAGSPDLPESLAHAVMQPGATLILSEEIAARLGRTADDPAWSPAPGLRCVVSSHATGAYVMQRPPPGPRMSVLLPLPERDDAWRMEALCRAPLVYTPPMFISDVGYVAPPRRWPKPRGRMLRVGGRLYPAGRMPSRHIRNRVARLLRRP
jgi:hypothetical protein